MHEVVVIGASVAGLACSIRLCELGIPVTCLEAGKIGTPSVCGEFIAGDCLDVLKEWDIVPSQPISHAHFVVPKGTISLSLDPQAAAMSRIQLIQELAAVARAKGAKIYESHPVVKVEPLKEGFSLQLEKEIWSAKHVVFSSGKLPLESLPTQQKPLVGMSLHLPRKDESALKMHAFRGGYLGMAPINETMLNCALIAKRGSDLDSLFERLALPQKSQWNEAFLPYFGYRLFPKWPHAYFIGDAYAFVPPCFGRGTSNAIHSALLAAHMIQKNNTSQFYTHLARATAAQMRWGLLLHRALCSPRANSLLFPFHTFSNFFFRRSQWKSHTHVFDKIGL